MMNTVDSQIRKRRFRFRSETGLLVFYAVVCLVLLGSIGAGFSLTRAAGMLVTPYDVRGLEVASR